jgi:hypothetical protein
MADNRSRAPQQNPADTRPDEIDTAEGSSGTRQPGYGKEFEARHRRRREAAKRLPPLPHSGRRDPLTYREVADCRERP